MVGAAGGRKDGSVHGWAKKNGRVNKQKKRWTVLHYKWENEEGEGMICVVLKGNVWNTEKKWDGSRENRGFSRNTTDDWERTGGEGHVEGSEKETTACCWDQTCISVNCDKHTWNTVMTTDSELDPTTTLFIHSSHSSPLPSHVYLKRGGLSCEEWALCPSPSLFVSPTHPWHTGWGPDAEKDPRQGPI